MMVMMKKASRHPGIKAGKKRPVGGVCRARSVRSSSPRPSSLLRGFSLMEVLMAIFILAIGVISITALFPAGIAQQRHANDDMMGPIVANNAMTLIRGKIRPEDFGADEGVFTPGQLRTLLGDWEWRRPVFFTQEAVIPTPFGDSIVPPGSISIFKFDSGETTGEDEPPIPWNKPLFGFADDDAPKIILTQQERFYPLNSGRERPQYVWDCLFRRFQGRILVAIFVYRVTSPGGGGVPYRVAANISSPTVPPLPIKVSFNSGLAWNAEMGANTTEPLNIIPNTNAGDAYDPANDGESWQLPGQMILDQNNIIHRVLAGRETPGDGPLELARPVAPVLGNIFDTNPGNLITESPFYFFGTPNFNTGMVQDGVVTRIWYLPEHMNIIVNGITTTYTITPVFITVREL